MYISLNYLLLFHNMTNLQLIICPSFNRLLFALELSKADAIGTAISYIDLLILYCRSIYNASFRFIM